MKGLLGILFLLSSLGCCMCACTTNVGTNNMTPQEVDTMIDARDGEVYTIIKIGEKIWMAENLRYKAPESMVHPENPSPLYGRLYDLLSSQTACPDGWHIASNDEWNSLELAHGMPTEDVLRGGWRGKHGTNMKATLGWDNNGNGTNSLGFNVLPAGYYFSGWAGTTKGLEGLGYSAAFWSSMEDSIASARFLFSSRKWVNKWEDKNNETGAALSCRCVKD